jgi:hypothetical protein
VLSIHSSDRLGTPSNSFSSILQSRLDIPYLLKSLLFKVLSCTPLFSLQLSISSYSSCIPFVGL